MDAGSLKADRAALLGGASSLGDEERPTPPAEASSSIPQPVPHGAAEAAAGKAEDPAMHGAVAHKLLDQRASAAETGRSKGASMWRLRSSGGFGAFGALWRSLGSCGVAVAVTIGFVLALALRAAIWGPPMPPSWLSGKHFEPRALFGHMAAKHPPPTCQRYVPSSCYFLPGQSPRQGPTPSVRVDFDVGDVLGQCPFASTGRYLNVPGPWCTDPPPPFWQEPHQPPGGRLRPTCGPGAACCGNNSIAGDFFRDDTTGRLQLDTQPMGCAYHEYTRKEVLQCMARPKGRSAFVFIGDSMTRQMFMRLISLFRGEERSFDYGPHTAARYDVCGGPFPADRFMVAQQMEGQHPFQQIDELPLDGLLNGREYQGPSPLDVCREPPVSADFVWAHDFAWQTHQIRRYILSHNMKDSIMTILVTYHEQRSDLDQIWLNAIGEASAVAKKVIVMTVPTSTYKPEFAGYIPLWRQRNELLREWMKLQPGFGKRLILLDFDKITYMKHAPTTLEGLDWHYQCIFNFEPPGSGMPMKAARHIEHRFLNPTGWALNRFIADDDRDCIDDMNRVMVNILMNIGCNQT